MQQAPANEKKTSVDSIWVFVVGLAVCVLMIAIHAMQAGHYVDFIPINGTFQNFNPVRRLLPGQVPYREFQDYLGLGRLISGSALTALLGGDFQASLVAFSFLSLISLAGIAYAAGRAILGSRGKAILVTDCVVAVLLLQATFFGNPLSSLPEPFSCVAAALKSGNSARFVRGAILPISCLVFTGILEKTRNATEATNGDSRAHMSYGIAVGLGALAGWSFAWSNDYGISCWLSLIVMVAWLSLSTGCGPLGTVGRLAVTTTTSVVTLLLVIAAATQGRIAEWATATFGTGGYQAWYYNSYKALWIYDLDYSPLVIVEVAMCLWYLWRVRSSCRQSGTVSVTDAVLGYMCMACVCAAQEYRLLSGNHNHEMAMAALLMCLLVGGVATLQRMRGLHEAALSKAMPAIALIPCVAWCVPAIAGEVSFLSTDEREGILVEALGGYNHVLGDDMLDAYERTHGASFFATYASGQEVVSGTFQPSGTDYVIHVLGDDAREEYLKCFREGDFDYVATIREGYNSWEWWVQRANWFLYREIYRDWHPVFANGYELWWERNAQGESHEMTEGISVSVDRHGDGEVRISVDCPAGVDGVADLLVSYEIGHADGPLAWANIRQVLQVVNTGVQQSDLEDMELYYLRGKSTEYIPVYVTDGHGEVTLTARPEGDVPLDMQGCSCDVIYTVRADFPDDVTAEGDGDILRIPLHAEEDMSWFGDVVTVEMGGRQYIVTSAEKSAESLLLTLGEPVADASDRVVQIHRNKNATNAMSVPVTTNSG